MKGRCDVRVDVLLELDEEACDGIVFRHLEYVRCGALFNNTQGEDSGFWCLMLVVIDASDA